MKSNLLTLLLVFIYFTASAQYSNTSHKEAVEVKAKTLLIALDEQNFAMVNKLKKEPEKLKAYQDFIAGKNEAMKNTVQKIWTFSKYEFKPAKEATRLVASKKTAYVLLKFSSIGDYTYSRSSQGMTAGKPVGYSYDIPFRVIYLQFQQ
jgi:thioredoxin-related protein